MKTLFVFLNLLTFLYSSALVPTNALSPAAGKPDERICDDQLINQNCGSPEITNSQGNLGSGQPFDSNNPVNSGSGQPGLSQPFASNNQGNSGSGQPFASNNQGNSGSDQPFASNNQGNSGSGQQGFGQPFGSNNQGNSVSGQGFSGTNGLPFLKNTRGNNIPFINEASSHEKKMTLLVVFLSIFTLFAITKQP